MNARDELVDEIAGHPIGTGYYSTTVGIDEAREIADAILAAGYRKAEPLWADSLRNDGTYEYTVSSDCDGSNVQYWRRVPGKTYIEAASPWQAYEPEPQP